MACLVLKGPVTSAGAHFRSFLSSGVQAAASLARAMALANLIFTGLQDIQATRFAQCALLPWFTE
jgi:hypothetical protein